MQTWGLHFFFFLPRLHADLMCCLMKARSPLGTSGTSGTSVALIRGRRVRANPGDISTPSDIGPIGPSHAEPKHTFQKQFSLNVPFCACVFVVPESVFAQCLVCGGMRRGSVCGFCFDCAGNYRSCVGPAVKRTPAGFTRSQLFCLLSESCGGRGVDRSGGSCEYFNFPGSQGGVRVQDSESFFPPLGKIEHNILQVPQEEKKIQEMFTLCKFLIKPKCEGSQRPKHLDCIFTRFTSAIRNKGIPVDFLNILTHFTLIMVTKLISFSKFCLFLFYLLLHS